VIIGVVAALDQRIGLRYTTMPPMSESENRQLPLHRLDVSALGDQH
jgi:type II secretory pathway predicted ATPase ExeA